jgi:hypothetical protein
MKRASYARRRGTTLSGTFESVRPPTPDIPAHPPGPISLLRALLSNPLDAWSRQHFEDLIVVARTPFGSRLVISDPLARLHVEAKLSRTQRLRHPANRRAGDIRRRKPRIGDPFNVPKTGGLPPFFTTAIHCV